MYNNLLRTMCILYYIYSLLATNYLYAAKEIMSIYPNSYIILYCYSHLLLSNDADEMTDGMKSSKSETRILLLPTKYKYITNIDYPFIMVLNLQPVLNTKTRARL